MTDHRDEGSFDPPGRDDRVAAAEDRAIAAEHRAQVAEHRHDDGGDRDRVVKSKPTYGVGSLLALLGALAIALGAFLNWVRSSGDFSTANANDVSIQFLWDPVPADSQPSLLFLVLGAAILVVVGTFIPAARVLAIIGGVVALVTAVLFFISVTRLISDFDLDDGAFDVVGLGWWLTGIGGIVAIVGSLLIPRRDVVR
jgi:hypothetical protein